MTAYWQQGIAILWGRYARPSRNHQIRLPFDFNQVCTSVGYHRDQIAFPNLIRAVEN